MFAITKVRAPSFLASPQEIALYDAVVNNCDDYVEVRYRCRQKTEISWRDGADPKVETVERAGFAVRTANRGAAPYFFEESADAALELLRQLRQQDTVDAAPRKCVCPPPLVGDFAPKYPADSTATANLARKVRLLEQYKDELSRRSAGFGTPAAHYVDWKETVYVLTASGVAARDIRLGAGIELELSLGTAFAWPSAIVELGGSAFEDDLQDVESAVTNLTDMSVRIQAARTVAPGSYPVIMDPELSGVFAHEVVGHLMEADLLASNLASAFRLQPGTQLAIGSFSVVDDPTIQGEGSYAFDDEGFPAVPVALIRHGRVAGLLHSGATSRYFLQQPNGRARAVEWDEPPVVRMSNTIVEPGNHAVDELFLGIRKGIYARGARSALGGTSFTIVPREAWWIENSRITNPIGGFEFTGESMDALSAITAVADDVRLYGGGIGGCFKNGQGPLRTGSGGPHIRLSSLLVVPVRGSSAEPSRENSPEITCAGDRSA